MSTTTHPDHPGLNQSKENGQNKVYLVLSDEERAKGFVRPLRLSYVHGGRKPRFSLRDLTAEEQERHAGYDYVKYEEYPESESPVCGRYWTQKDLDSGCGVSTSMGRTIAETYAREPKFYGSTYCVGCKEHLPVDEFQWDDGSTVGS